MSGSPIVLVTGGTGSIGSCAVRNLVKRGCRVVALDLRPRPEMLGGVRESVDIVAADLADRRTVATVLAEWDISHVLHLGAMLSFDAARDPLRAVEVNSVATLALFDAALSSGVGRVVWASTSGMYGGPGDYGDRIVDDFHVQRKYIDGRDQQVVIEAAQLDGTLTPCVGYLYVPNSRPVEGAWLLTADGDVIDPARRLRQVEGLYGIALRATEAANWTP